MPALLTTMSSRPHRSSAADTSPDATSALVTITDDPRRVETSAAQSLTRS